MKGAFHLGKPMADFEPPTVEWPQNKKGDVMRLLPTGGRQKVKSSQVKYVL